MTAPKKSLAEEIEALIVAKDLKWSDGGCPMDCQLDWCALAAIAARLREIAGEMRKPPYDRLQEVWADELAPKGEK